MNSNPAITSDSIAKSEYQLMLSDARERLKTMKKEYKRISNKKVAKMALVEYYVLGFSKKQIASMLMCSTQTVTRMLKEEEVTDMILEYQEKQKADIDMELKALRDKATDVARELLDSDDDSVRLQMYKDIMDRTGHTIKKDTNVNVNISYEQQLQQLADGIVLEVEEYEGES